MTWPPICAMAAAQFSEWNMEPGDLRVDVEDEPGNVVPTPQKCGMYVPRSGEGCGEYRPLHRATTTYTSLRSARSTSDAPLSGFGQQVIFGV